MFAPDLIGPLGLRWRLVPKREQEVSRMFSANRRRIAIETIIKSDHSYADTVAALGYANRHAPRNWRREYERASEAPVGKVEREPKYPNQQKREAVEHYLSHGRRLTHTVRMLGRPGSRLAFGEWVDELAPGDIALGCIAICTTPQKLEAMPMQVHPGLFSSKVELL